MPTTLLNTVLLPLIYSIIQYTRKIYEKDKGFDVVIQKKFVNKIIFF
jgi:hypothetical protein